MPDSDQQRHMRITGSGLDGKFTIRELSISESLSQPFVITITAESSDLDFAHTDILGNHLTVEVDITDSVKRYFDGLVTKFTFVGMAHGLAEYHLQIHPWFYILKNSVQCKIFQNKDVPTIIKEVFRAREFDDFEDKLQRTDYLKLEYCVQYRESDFDFVSRLMEHEGIYYYFSHQTGQHKLVLCDDTASHDKYQGQYGTLKVGDVDIDSQEGTIYHFSVTQEMQAGQYTVSDFDLEKPNTDLTKSKSISETYTHNTYEMYEYPGKYTEATDGASYANVHMEEHIARFERASGSTAAKWVATGCLITLPDLQRSSLTGEYLVLSTLITATSEGSNAGISMLHTDLEAIKTSRVFRPERRTPKPYIRGPQTAMVSGQDGDEILTDKYGRVKVQFHWDRPSVYDTPPQPDATSCWVRCAQLWAGKQWGGQFVPRIGMEVVVQFLDGDPDRPLITGAVYNANSMPPYDLPANATQSGIKSNSSKGGGGSNEIRFEDKKGSEEFFMHAQYDMHTEVENDQTITVKKGNRKLTVKEGAETHEVTQGDRTVTVKQGNQSHEVTAGDLKVKVGAGKHTTEVMSDTSLKISTGNYTLEASAGQMSIKAAQAIAIESDMKITLTVGGNSITIDPSGVAIKGIMVKAEGQAMVNVKGPMVQVSADGILELKGGITMIG